MKRGGGSLEGEHQPIDEGIWGKIMKLVISNGSSRSFTSLLMAVLLLLAGNQLALAKGAVQGGYYSRPVPVGSAVGNDAIWYGTSATQQTPGNVPGSWCASQWGTLGALVRDQNGNQYILSSAHVLALGVSGYIESNVGTPIDQPDVLVQVGLNGTNYCSAITPQLISTGQVASLGIVAPPSFAKGTSVPAEVALAPVLPGMVSPNILGISAFSSTPISVIKKGIEVQKSGQASGLTLGTVTKMKMTYPISLCTVVPDGQTPEHCHAETAYLQNVFEIKGKGKPFLTPRDSGSLVLTRGTCPQPIGLAEAGNNAGNNTAVASAISDSAGGVLQTLNFVSGDTYSIVPSTTGCGSTLGI